MGIGTKVPLIKLSRHMIGLLLRYFGRLSKPSLSSQPCHDLECTSSYCYSHGSQLFMCWIEVALADHHFLASYCPDYSHQQCHFPYGMFRYRRQQNDIHGTLSPRWTPRGGKTGCSPRLLCWPCCLIRFVQAVDPCYFQEPCFAFQSI